MYWYMCATISYSSSFQFVLLRHVKNVLTLIINNSLYGMERIILTNFGHLNCISLANQTGMSKIYPYIEFTNRDVWNEFYCEASLHVHA